MRPSVLVTRCFFLRHSTTQSNNFRCKICTISLDCIHDLLAVINLPFKFLEACFNKVPLFFKCLNRVVYGMFVPTALSFSLILFGNTAKAFSWHSIASKISPGVNLFLLCAPHVRLACPSFRRFTPFVSASYTTSFCSTIDKPSPSSFAAATTKASLILNSAGKLMLDGCEEDPATE